MLRDKYHLRNEEGSAMLIVVILMSILLVMTTIVFGYALREYRMTQSTDSIIGADMQANRAVGDTLTELTNRLNLADGIIDDDADVDNSIGSFAIKRYETVNDVEIGYDVTVMSDGEYDAAEYQMLGGMKTYVLQRVIPVADEEPEDVEEPEAPGELGESEEPEEPEEPEILEIDVKLIALSIEGKWGEEKHTRKLLVNIFSDSEDKYVVDVYEAR